MTSEVKEEPAEVVEAAGDAEQPIEQTPEVSTAEQKQSQSRSQTEIEWEKAHYALAQQKAEIQALRDELQKKASPPPAPEKDEFADLDPEEYLTAAKGRAMAEKMAERKAREAAKAAVDEYAREQNVRIDESVARGKYQDYDYVVETFAVPMIKSDPALAHKIMNSKNPAETAYRLGKLSDEYQDKATEKPTHPKAEKVMKNLSRPTSGHGAPGGLKTQANEFASMSKQQIWEQSERYARGGL